MTDKRMAGSTSSFWLNVLNSGATLDTCRQTYLALRRPCRGPAKYGRPRKGDGHIFIDAMRTLLEFRCSGNQLITQQTSLSTFILSPQFESHHLVWLVT